MATEDVILLDADGVAVGTAPKAAVHHSATPLHLAFSCYLVDAAGRVLLTRRAAGKATWPGVWSNSCCGHPLPDEPLDDAVRRRLRDELGARAEAVELVLPAFRYRAVMSNGIVEHELCPVYRASTGAPDRLDPDPSEVAEVRWQPWPAVAAMAGGPAGAVSPWFRRQVVELRRLGDDPRRWPVGDRAELPPAARGMPARD